MRKLVVLLAACSHASLPAPPSNTAPATPPAAEACKLLPDWNPDEMARGGMHYDPAPAVTEVRVLAWQQIIDERPLRVDSALLWVQTQGKTIQLVHVYRHPDDKDAWHQARVYDSPTFAGMTVLSARPTRAEIDAFLGATEWTFAAPDGFRLVASGLCSDAWTKSFGERPWHAYKN